MKEAEKCLKNGCYNAAFLLAAHAMINSNKKNKIIEHYKILIKENLYTTKQEAKRAIEDAKKILQ